MPAAWARLHTRKRSGPLLAAACEGMGYRSKGVSLDVLIEKINEKDETGRKWDEIPVRRKRSAGFRISGHFDRVEVQTREAARPGE